jgi:hypothetical protein
VKYKTIVLVYHLHFPIYLIFLYIDDFKGNLIKKKYVSIANTTSATTSRDLSELIEVGCIKGTASRNITKKISQKLGLSLNLFFFYLKNF